MLNLDEAITQWRRQTAAGGLRRPALLDELESHLRADIRALTEAGTPEAQAFQIAVSRLGEAGPLRTEFNKLEKARWWPVTLCCWLFAAGMLLLPWVLARGVLAGKFNLLLCAHIWSVTAGYVGAFVAGGFGILYVFAGLFSGLRPNRRQALGRAVRVLSLLSAGTVIAGGALGMLWYRRHFGKYAAGDAKEFGALAVAVWFVVLSAALRLGRISERAAMLACVGGNIVVSLAWFGAAILEKGSSMYGFLPLALSVFVGIHIVFLLMGLTTAAVRQQ